MTEMECTTILLAKPIPRQRISLALQAENLASSQEQIASCKTTSASLAANAAEGSVATSVIPIPAKRKAIPSAYKRFQSVNERTQDGSKIMPTSTSFAADFTSVVLNSLLPSTANNDANGPQLSPGSIRIGCESEPKSKQSIVNNGNCIRSSGQTTQIQDLLNISATESLSTSDEATNRAKTTSHTMDDSSVNGNNSNNNIIHNESNSKPQPAYLSAVFVNGQQQPLTAARTAAASPSNETTLAVANTTGIAVLQQQQISKNDSNASSPGLLVCRSNISFKNRSTSNNSEDGICNKAKTAINCVDNPLYLDANLCASTKTSYNTNSGTKRTAASQYSRVKVPPPYAHPRLSQQQRLSADIPNSLELSCKMLEQKDSALSSDASAQSPQLASSDSSAAQNGNEDVSSLDSACGSSPVSSHEHFGSQQTATCSTNAMEETEANALPRSSSKQRWNLQRVSTIGRLNYKDLKSTINKILFCASRIQSLLVAANMQFQPQDRKTYKYLRDFLQDLDRLSPDILAYNSVQEFSSSVLSFYEPGASGDESRSQYGSQLYEEYQSILDATLVGFVQVILDFIAIERVSEPMLESALNHLAHCGLFGDYVCLEIIKAGAISALTRIAKTNHVPNDGLRLTLRALAVLCSVSKGCVELLALGGLELIVRLLCSSPTCCAVEAAGVLTQLTAPVHTFAALPPSLPKTISRLLDLCDESRDPDGFLLCSAAIANLSLQHNLVSDLLYRHNAVLRINRVYHTKTCQSIFIQDQVATIFQQLCSHNFIDALVAQGGVPVLLSMVQTQTVARHEELCRKILFKAAICLGRIATDGYGLKCLQENNAMFVCMRVLAVRPEVPSPVAVICKSIMKKLEQTFCSHESQV